MPFYEALKLLITEPGKHHFRRKSWNGEYEHNNTKFIASFGLTTTKIAVVIVNKDNDTGYEFYPSYDDIITNDWMEV